MCYKNNNCLPTAEEYRKSTNELRSQFEKQWSEPKYQCPECGGGMCRDEATILPTYPAQYEYKCNQCGHIDYQYR